METLFDNIRKQNPYSVYAPPQEVDDNAQQQVNGAGATQSVSSVSPATTTMVTPFTPDKTQPDGGMLDYLGKMYSSPEDMEKLRKRSRTRAMIAGVGDALRHAANLYYTTKGATPQQYNSPVQEEQQRYEKERTRRENYNNLYLQQKEKQNTIMRDQYWKQADYERKLASDKRAEEKNNAYIEYQNSRMQYNAAKAKKDEVMAAYWETKAEQLANGASIEEATRLAKLKQIEAQTALARARAANVGNTGSGRGGGMDEYTTTTTTTYDTDEWGNRTGQTTVKKREVKGRSGSSTSTTTKQSSTAPKKQGEKKSGNDKKKVKVNW